VSRCLRRCMRGAGVSQTGLQMSEREARERVNGYECAQAHQLSSSDAHLFNGFATSEHLHASTRASTGRALQQTQPLPVHLVRHLPEFVDHPQSLVGGACPADKRLGPVGVGQPAGVRIGGPQER
jgi:hypothetical protein